MTDAFLSKITNIKDHPNADSLQLATVNNWQVIIKKDSFKENDSVVFISPDAVLPIESEWVKPYLNYIGKTGRVKTVKLRGEFSNGITIAEDEILSHIDVLSYECGPDDDEHEIISRVLCNALNITHYNPYIHSPRSSASLNGDALHMGLPYGMPKTDEDNWQSLPEYKLALGEKCLITRKLDGSSITMTATPEGEFFVSSRNITFKDGVENTYTAVASEYKDRLIAYAIDHNKKIAIQGEMTGLGINTSKVNIDCVGSPKFNMFGVLFPDEVDIALRNGWYGTSNHFLEINKELGVPTVPVIGEFEITKELLQEYTNAPCENGEGVVVDCASGSYKVKSSDYYSKLK